MRRNMVPYAGRIRSRIRGNETILVKVEFFDHLVGSFARLLCRLHLGPHAIKVGSLGLQSLRACDRSMAGHDGRHSPGHHFVQGCEPSLIAAAGIARVISVGPCDAEISRRHNMLFRKVGHGVAL